MSRTRFLVPIGLLLFLALCLVPTGQAQISNFGQQNTPSFASNPAQLAVSFNFNSSSTQTGAFTTGGLGWFTLIWIPTGTVSGCTLTVDGANVSGGTFSTGSLIASQTCTSAGSFTTGSAVFTSVQGKISPTITGSGSVTVFLFGYINSPSSGGVSANSTIVSPVDVSGYVNVHCQSGCAGGNANGQATMANSAPVVIASNQSAVSTTDSNPVAQGSTTSGEKGPLDQGAVTTAAPTYTTGQTSPLSLNTSGGLRVDGSGVTQPVSGTVTTTPPANASANVAQFGGTNVSTGTGAGGAGIPRVTISNDSSLAANQSVNLNQWAGSTLIVDPCMVNARSVFIVNFTASTQVVTGTGGKQTYICFLQISLNGNADNIALVEGTGATCGTGTAGMAGGATAATGWNLLANGSVTAGTIERWAYKSATLADNLCLLVSSTAQVSGVIQYVQQ